MDKPHGKEISLKVHTVYRTNDLTLYSFSWLYIFVTWGWPTVAETCRRRNKTDTKTVVFWRSYPLLTPVHCIVSPHYTFLWHEDGPQWPKHVVSLIKQIQRQLCFDVPTHLIICTKHNGDDASKKCIRVFCRPKKSRLDLLGIEPATPRNRRK